MSEFYRGISYPFRFGANGGVTNSVLTNDDFSRIRESIYQILFTYKKERVNNNEFGSRLREYLFEPYDEINTLAMLKFETERAISEQEPRVEVLDVRVYTLPEEEGKVYIDIDVLITQFNTSTTLEYEFSQSNNAT